jgi:hypothetical protein
VTQFELAIRDTGEALFAFPAVLGYSGGRSDGSKPLTGQDGLISSNFFGQSSFASSACCFLTMQSVYLKR